MPKKTPAENPAELSNLEVIALANAVPTKRLTAAKHEMSDNSSGTVDLTVRIRAHVAKGASTPDATVEVLPTVNLATLAVFTNVLSALGIGEKRLAAALANIPADAEAVEDLACVFDHEADRRAAAMPAMPRTTPGRAGSVSVDAIVTRV